MGIPPDELTMKLLPEMCLSTFEGERNKLLALLQADFNKLMRNPRRRERMRKEIAEIMGLELAQVRFEGE